MAAGLDSTQVPVNEIMTSSVLAVDPFATLDECLDLMVSRGVGRVPVVDNTGTLLGIVAQADMRRQARSARLGRMSG